MQGCFGRGMGGILTFQSGAYALSSIALAVILSACSAGAGTGLDQNGRPLSEGGGSVPATIQSIFNSACIKCHQGASAPLGLRLDDANSYATLVGVASVEVPSMRRAEPGSPDNSYLVRKLEGTMTVGDRMPLGDPPLSQATIDTIRAWIGSLPTQPASNTPANPAPAPAPTPTPPPSGTIEPSWRWIQDNVFTPICTACHIGTGAPEGLRLDEQFSYQLLVGKPSQQIPSLLRVAPGDPDNSYLIQKLNGTAADGSRMPLGGSPLPQATMDAIRQWITNGAPATSASGAPTATPDANPALTWTVDAPIAVNKGDNFTVTATITNAGTNSASGINATLTWNPTDSARLASASQSQSFPTLAPGQSTTISWTLRAENTGNLDLACRITYTTGVSAGQEIRSVSIM